MTILPLIGRQLRVRARSPTAYWTRFGAALAGTLMCLSMLTGLSSAAQVSAFAFQGLIVAAFVLCCFSGFLTVDGISRERREGTLGLLFLTRVKTLDVLLGNFGAAGIASLCALAALAPVLIVPVLAGGVTGGEAARKVLALFDTMILSLAAGLWASAGGHEWRSCARSAAELLLLLIFGPLLLGALLPFYTHFQPWWPGPLSALVAADDSWYKRSAAPYWISIAVVHAISWLLVIGAGIRLRRALREDDETPANPANFAPKRKPLAVGDAPLDWLVRRQSGIRTVVWAAALLGSAYHYTFLFGGLFVRGILGVYSSWGMGLASSVVEGCLLAWAASRFFIEARRAGELELLLTTPEGAKTIVASQWNWLTEVIRWPLLVLVMPLFMRSLINTQLASFMVFSILNTFVGIVALLRVGMWFGWSERSQARAVVRIVILTKGVPYLVATVGSLVLVGLVRSTINTWFKQVWFTPQLVTLFYYLGLIRWARRRLAGELRQANMAF
jgi:hypothetical protein